MLPFSSIGLTVLTIKIQCTLGQTEFLFSADVIFNYNLEAWQIS